MGIAATKHKHLLQIARALLENFGEIHSHCPAYIIKRLPTPVLNWKSPYEILYGQPPCYNSFKTFGCLCLATTNSC